MRLHPIAFLGLMLSASAQAAWPEDVSLSSMTELNGVPVLDTPVLSEAYGQVVRELGAAVGTHSILAPHTLGASGFEITIDTTMAFTSTGTINADGVAPWERVHVNEDPGPFLYAPGIMVRKGLPFSLEIGAVGRWIGSSRQGTFGGFLRAGLVEGKAPWPDIAVKIGYTGYIGNDELELGTFELSGTLGGNFHVGGLLKSTHVAPYADIGLMVVSAAPRLDDETAQQIGAVAYGRRTTDPDVVPTARPIPLARFAGGLELTTGAFLVRLSGGYTLNAGAFANAAIGLTY